MKKIVSLALLILLSFTLCSCDMDSKGQDDNDVSSLSNEEIKTELDDIFDTICSTNTDCEELSSIVYNYWNYNGYEAFFDYDVFLSKDAQFNTNQNYAKGSFYGDARLAFRYRDTITRNLDEVQSNLKSLPITEETESYYNAIKELYICVDSFYSLASDYPEGYSKITYLQAISAHQDEYEKFVSAVKFEQ